ncbi:MAG: hypothetical protein QM688_10435 [Sphingomonas bacterium]
MTGTFDLLLRQCGRLTMEMTRISPTDTRAPTANPKIRLPEGFDLSRLGPHVRAAYLGPTPDNPFLTLRNRLKRARFYDERERRDAEQHRDHPAAKP